MSHWALGFWPPKLCFRLLTLWPAVCGKYPRPHCDSHSQFGSIAVISEPISTSRVWIGPPMSPNALITPISGWSISEGVPFERRSRHNDRKTPAGHFGLRGFGVGHDQQDEDRHQEVERPGCRVWPQTEARHHRVGIQVRLFSQLLGLCRLGWLITTGLASNVDRATLRRQHLI